MIVRSTYRIRCFPRCTRILSIGRVFLINEVAEPIASKASTVPASCVSQQWRKIGGFSRVSRSWVGSGSDSYARSVNCRQLTRYLLAGVSSCQPPPYRSYSGLPPPFLYVARTPWEPAVNHRSCFCRYNATSSPLIVTKSTPPFIPSSPDKDSYRSRRVKRTASINLCTDFFGQTYRGRRNR